MPPILPVLPLHLGALHPVEQALTFVLAFGPFLVLGIVIWARRRADTAEDARQGSGSDPGVEAEAQRDR